MTAPPASTAADPEVESELAAVRRRIAGELREAREYQAELDGVSRERDAERRRLEEACAAWEDELAPAAKALAQDPRNTATSRHFAASSAPIDPTSPEAVAARETALDRLLARNWPGASR